MIELKKLANMVDHTLLKADATKEGLEQLCKEADEYGFKMKCRFELRSGRAASNDHGVGEFWYLVPNNDRTDSNGWTDPVGGSHSSGNIRRKDDRK